jgi:glycosyltransferase involved in cell wall biosynthesis
MLKVYWFGYGGSSWMAEKLRSIIEDDLEMKLITIHEHPDANVPWNRETIYKELEKADIIIVPTNFKKQTCKSNNRLTQAMALGKPVICDPLPAYKNIVKQLENAIITTEGKDFEYKFWLQKLRDDESLRKKLGKNALETAKKYSLEKISKHWINELISLASKGSDQTAIDVIIPTKNNIEILDQCLKSFKNSTLTEEIYIIDNGDGNAIENLLKDYDILYEIKNI